MFGNAGREHMKLYGTKPEHFAKIAEKNHRHSIENPNSQFRDEYTLQQVLIYITKTMGSDVNSHVH